MHNVLAVCCTHNRFQCLQRSLRCFLMQDYPYEHTLLIFNTGQPITLGELPILYKYPLKKVVLVNEDASKYRDVGSKYQDAVEYAKQHLGDFDVFNSWDDDDLMLPCHISEGVKGYNRSVSLGKKAYKPLMSYYRDREGVHLVSNVHEPSIFVSFKHVLRSGFNKVSVRYHQGWLDVLEKDGGILVERGGKPTWLYDWHPELGVYKMSGLGEDNGINFEAHQKHSNDTGAGAPLKPSLWKSIQEIFEQAKVLHELG